MNRHDEHKPEKMTEKERKYSGCYLCQIYPLTAQQHQWPVEAVEKALKNKAEIEKIRRWVEHDKREEK